MIGIFYYSLLPTSEGQTPPDRLETGKETKKVLSWEGEGFEISQEIYIEDKWSFYPNTLLVSSEAVRQILTQSIRKYACDQHKIDFSLTYQLLE